MKRALFLVLFAGCDLPRLEHDPCGGIDGPTCAEGLDCVSTVLCYVGPCPGTCLAPCAAGERCGADASCEAPAGYDAEDRYCVASD